MGPLGRRPPKDWVHVERFSLPAPPKQNLPVVVGSLWLASMDQPVKGTDGRWRICTQPNWMNAPTRGGHAYCLQPLTVSDNWWPNHDQQRGSCTGHSIARAAELLYRKAHDSEAWYDRNQQVDEWADTPPQEGSSVRAAFDVWRNEGAIPLRGGTRRKLRANRWATSGEDIGATLGYQTEVPILQSWGRAWPRRVWAGLEVLDWLLPRDGEAGVPVL